MLAAPAFAAPTLPSKLYYRISWSGLPLGRIRVDCTETDSSYSMLIDTKSKGVVSVFSPFQTLAQTHGIKQNGRYLPTRYVSQAEKSDEGEDRATSIDYDSVGRIVKRTVTPPDDPAWRPIVALEKVLTIPDPITGFIQIRHALSEAEAQGLKEAIIRTYDGKRFAQLKAKIIPSEKPNLIATRITRKPLDGYTPKELKKFKKGDPELIVWFEKNNAFMPNRLELSMMLGTITVQKSIE